MYILRASDGLKRRSIRSVYYNSYPPFSILHSTYTPYYIHTTAFLPMDFAPLLSFSASFTLYTFYRTPSSFLLLLLSRPTHTPKKCATSISSSRHNTNLTPTRVTHDRFTCSLFFFNNYSQLFTTKEGLATYEPRKK